MLFLAFGWVSTATCRLSLAAARRSYSVTVEVVLFGAQALGRMSFDGCSTQTEWFWREALAQLQCTGSVACRLQ